MPVKGESNGGKKSRPLSVIHAANIIRPQLRFEDKIDNSANTPFKRKITYKPNAMKPLDDETSKISNGIDVHSPLYK